MKKGFLCLLLITCVKLAFAQQSCPKWGPYVKALHAPGSGALVWQI